MYHPEKNKNVRDTSMMKLRQANLNKLKWLFAFTVYGIILKKHTMTCRHNLLCHCYNIITT